MLSTFKALFRPESAAALESEHRPGIKLGVLLNPIDLPPEEERQAFMAAFGVGHCFLSKTRENTYEIYSQSGTRVRIDYESLPVDYIYCPDDWNRRLTDDQIRNVLLCFSHTDNDFAIVSASLSELPNIAVSSLKNHAVFSKALGLNFPDTSNHAAKGRVLRLLPYNHPVSEIHVEQIFPPESLRWTPDGCLYLNGATPSVQWPTSKTRVSVSFTPHRPAFIPEFKKQKPLIFVWPIFMVVGGAERNAIEIMKELRDHYHFVVITMERPYKNQGSLHHQLAGIAEAVYDLGELAPFHTYLEMLADLKQVYAPEAIWTANGSPWFCDHAQNLRELFQGVPIIDQQVYDTNRGWILRYREPGIQSFDRFIAINKKIQDLFINRFKMDPAKIDLIYHAVDSHRFDPSRYLEQDRRHRLMKFGLEEGREVFVFVGRLAGQKRPLDFLELALRRQRAGDKAFFAMVGDGDLSAACDEFIGRHELKNVRRIPFVENMAELFSIASGLIMTSEFEGLPIVMLEALCMGLPVLATDVGDIKLILDQYQAGLVVPLIGNLDSIEQSYETWIREMPSYRANANAQAEAIRNRFSEKAVAQQYADSWDRARESAGTSPNRTFKYDADLVSIIIPSYNHAEYVKSAIDSALAQSYPQIEVIVVDDGSSDSTVEILKNVKDPRFNYFVQENMGAHVAINRGLQLASGEFLTILNSDDMFHPDRVSNLLAEFQNDPEVELLATWIEVIDANGQQLGIKQGWHNLEPWPIAHPELSFKETEDFLLNLLMGNFVATTSNIMMRHALWEKIGGMRNLRFTHDWDFLLRAAAATRCKLVPKPLIRYRVHGTNTISSNRAWMLFEICWVLAANLHRVEGAQIFNKAEPQRARQDVERLYESINLQGNDKVFWVMRALIESLKSAGMENAEEILLEDKELREKFIGYIQV